MTARPDVNWGTVTAKFMDKKATTIDFSPLVDMIDLLSIQAKSKIAIMRSKKSSMSIADMFDLQMAMNKLSQFSEMSTGVIGAINGSISTINRNLKG
jgi:hypothetical protein